MEQDLACEPSISQHSPGGASTNLSVFPHHLAPVQDSLAHQWAQQSFQNRRSQVEGKSGLHLAARRGGGGGGGGGGGWVVVSKTFKMGDFFNNDRMRIIHSTIKI